MPRTNLVIAAPLMVAAALLVSGPAAGQQAASDEADVGVLVMAHGGTPEWDAAVVSAVEPIRERLPTALAMGMADPSTLQAALDSLENQGVETVAVVRLFLSGESFLHDTEFYLGLRDDAPAMPMAAMMHRGGHGHEMGPVVQLDRSAEILLEMRGLAETPLTASIVADRARHTSTDPGRESVILIAHGMGDEGENRRVLGHMAASVDSLRSMGFRDVHAATLREDWPEAREHAEAEIRAWVESRSGQGDRVIVVPFRLFGFGGYAEVLSGQSYTPTGSLLPHAYVTSWIEQSAVELFCSRAISTVLGECGKS